MEMPKSEKKIKSTARNIRWRRILTAAAKHVGQAVFLGAASAAGAHAFNSIVSRGRRSDVVPLKRVV